MESMRLLITSWGILSHSSRRALSSSWRVCGGGWRPATRLPRASQTCSIGFIYGEHVGYSIRTIPSSKRKSSTRIIPTAMAPPDENTPIIRMNRKVGLVRKKSIAPFISPPVHMFCCPLPAVATMP
ncbi:hypothetical protein TNCV_2363471 [Trichonephila clavipes]|nr:hypothetical protein TNCV_2363471 [Trichonephila clavipes]